MITDGRGAALVAAALVGCGPGQRAANDAGTMPLADAPPNMNQPDANDCPALPNPAGPEVVLAPPFDMYYAAYDLGAPPGIPDPLGGTTVLISDQNTLLIGGASETGAGAIYSIGVTRDSCHHITGFTGTATQVATTPYVDANLVYYNHDLLLYTEWPVFKVGELVGAATTPSLETDLRTVGMASSGDEGPGGLGIVPPGLAAAGQLRLVTWPAGNWYHAATTPAPPMLTFNSVTETTTVPNEPGGFAYVPAGSPGFSAQTIIMAEWGATNQVVVYDADGSGDPMPATRRLFFSMFPKPWGAYFEPVTGDFLFLSWGTGNDHVYLVTGFVPPPVIL